MTSELNRCGVVPTIYVTMSTLKIHPELAGDLESLEVGLHGYEHIDYASLPERDQVMDLDASLEVAASFGLRMHGFRAPYLKADKTTMHILAQRGLEYDSSSRHYPASRDTVFHKRVLEEINRRYGLEQHPLGANRTDPRITEIPVSLPDDEILLDGLGIRSASTLRSVFESMVMSAANRHQALVMQIHPERFELCAEAISNAIRLAFDLGAWTATVVEITRWARSHQYNNGQWPDGRPFAFAVSGDLDALTLSDYVSRLRRRLK